MMTTMKTGNRDVWSLKEDSQKDNLLLDAGGME